MNSLKQTKEQIRHDQAYWSIYLMDFVDDFRRHKSVHALVEPFALTDNRFDALLASTAETLCDEQRLVPPAWLTMIPACHDPWFVANMESLKAIALAESPLRFRIRKIFVLENFLERV